MSEVKRWHMPRGTSVSDDKDGEFVLASDYDALAAECERLREETAVLLGDIAELEVRRDAALAELAALKGGQEPVAMIRYARGVPGFENEMPHVVSCNDLPDGLYPVYLAPPAQSSAWVPVSESLPADRRDVMLYCADTKEHFVGFSKGGGLFQFAQDGNGLSIVCRPSHWRYIEDSEAPTPGASDGKGGKS